LILSRGERSRPERTAEERRRDREEREHKRAGRSGQDAGAPAPEHQPEPSPEPAIVQPPQDPPEQIPQESPDPSLEELAPPDGLPEPPTASPDVPHEPVEEEQTPQTAEHAEPPPADHNELSPADHTEPPPADHTEPPPAEPLPVASQEPAQPAPTPQRILPGKLSAPPPLPPLPVGPRLGGRAPKDDRGHAGRSFARIGALAALAAVVVVAAILLVNSLAGSKKEKPALAPAIVKVLIPEGKTRAQIAEVAKAAGLLGSYRAAAKSSSLLNPAHYGAPGGTPDLEGFLFPATYELDRGTQVSQLVHEQLIAFQENFRAEYFRRAKALHVSAYQLLIIASMVEREAQVSGDRAKIAAVIYNRLADGMPLGIDASIYYAVEEEQHIATYTHELTESQLHIDSPYNTRTHKGLPPTPISNPGVASIKAAAHPAHVAYLYYVAGADGCGEQVFSDTLAEFEANAASYEAAVKRNGGHPPSCKHH
jgi:cell division protein YceG involved in septum cleavage